MHLADSSVWIAIASILATLHISKAVGDDGKEIMPRLGFEDGLTRYLRFFSCQCRRFTIIHPVILAIISVSIGLGLRRWKHCFHDLEHRPPSSSFSWQAILICTWAGLFVSI